ncbi:Deoxyribonuclease-2-like protein [Dinothrombium tinctorium]|uniref:Deoxyribonuclease-2-like protein n=1 Tax=Dinothrombium tinctorium TaxID=1965070 RepID=A0A3S4RBP1_9ACAR|nr:Deoxyribonuclease-2-like protein [Dinothrombium tinctorium]
MMLKASTFRFVSFLIFFRARLLLALSCKNEFGQHVDWFIAYKIPELYDSKGALSTGLAYAFVTSEQPTSSWTLAKNLINESSSIFGQTLEPFYKSREKYTHVMYNDEPPNSRVSSYYAHAKGVMGMDEKNGIWLSHSVPKFPPPFEKSYNYPDTGRLYGQTAICITFSTKAAAYDIVEHLLITRPDIYFEHYTEEVMKIANNLPNLREREWSHKRFLQNELKSLEDKQFVIFSKSKMAHYDLYDHFIAPYVESNLLAETWRRGAGHPLPSDCKTTFEVLNVQEVDLPFTNAKIKQSGEWKYLKDHSKWAVSETKNKSFVCIADLNRMRSQYKRGGGAVCFRNVEVWTLFKNSVAGIEGCPRKREFFE